MTTATAFRLPGVSFDYAPPVLEDELPRMDVAAFVGFASSGPLHVPVVVEDVARFRDVFGPDAPLARDVRSGERTYAMLGPAVEGFFRNGGRRCWVVRVADSASAVRSRWPLAGLVVADRAERPWRLATVDARAVGSWADELTVLPVAASERLPAAVAVDVEERALGLSADAALVAGDMLRLTTAGGDVTAIVTVRTVDRVGGGVRVGWDRCWLQRGAIEDDAASAAVVDHDGERPLPGAPRITTAGAAGRLVLEFDTDAPPPGSLLRIRFAEGPDLAARVDAVVRGTAEARGWLISEPDTRELTDHLAGLPAVVERLHLSLLTWRGEHLVARLDELGTTPGHPRSVHTLPTDEQLYAKAEQAASGSTGPRFPLAARADDGALPLLPLGVVDTPSDTAARGPLTDTSPVTAMERDGLACFGAALFLDPDLAETGLDGLLREAHARTSLGSGRRAPRGIHALLPLDEATLVAVPDAVGPGWRSRDLPPPRLPAAPTLSPVRVEGAEATLCWSLLDDAVAYVVERSGNADMSDPTVLLDGPPPQAPGCLPLVMDRCRGELYFRVRARDTAGVAGPWSRTVSALLPPGDFDPCNTGIEAPVLALASDRLTWAQRPGSDIEVEDSPRPGFDGRVARHTFEGSASARLEETEELRTYYRARYRDAERAGPWSNTVSRPGRPTAVLATDEPEPGELFDETLGVHRGLVRLAAARRDMLTVLALPRHYREVETLEHLALLRGTLGGAEYDALGHAAVHHPWTVVRTGGGVRAVTPDGAVIGSIAHRTVERGAWISPGNIPLAGVVALDPPLRTEAELRLLDAGVDVVGRRQAGFFPLTAKTLATDPHLQPIGVRRLLILLRRLALRHGTTYVFEPQGHRLRQLVQQSFEALLTGLFKRGAFAGAVPDEGFRVVTDATVNPPTLADTGRFVVELQVAPAQPLEFLRVRLVQTRSGAVTVTEVPR